MFINLTPGKTLAQYLLGRGGSQSGRPTATG